MKLLRAIAEEDTLDGIFKDSRGMKKTTETSLFRFGT